MDYEVFAPDDWDEFLDEICAQKWSEMFSEGWDLVPDAEEEDARCLSTS